MDGYCIMAANVGRHMIDNITAAEENKMVNKCLVCGTEIPEGYQWCTAECKDVFHDEHFGVDMKQEEMDKQTLLDEHAADVEKVKKHKTKKKDGFVKRIWNATIFPDKIKAAKEEKRAKRELMTRVKKQALEQLEPELVKAAVAAETEKIKQKARPLSEKLDDFGKKMQAGLGTFDTEAKLNTALGRSPKTQRQHRNPRPQQQQYVPAQPQYVQQQPQYVQQQPQYVQQQPQYVQQQPQEQYLQPQMMNPADPQTVQQSVGPSNNQILQGFGMGGNSQTKEEGEEKIKRMLGRG